MEQVYKANACDARLSTTNANVNDNNTVQNSHVLLEIDRNSTM